MKIFLEGYSVWYGNHFRWFSVSGHGTSNQATASQRFHGNVGVAAFYHFGQNRPE